jgi:hypothetical protein
MSGVQLPIWGESSVGNSEGNSNRHPSECGKSQSMLRLWNSPP